MTNKLPQSKNFTKKNKTYRIETEAYINAQLVLGSTVSTTIEPLIVMLIFYFPLLYMIQEMIKDQKSNRLKEL